MTEPNAVQIIARHADFISRGERHCTCGEWVDRSVSAQKSRLTFAHHVLAALALYGYAAERRLA